MMASLKWKWNRLCMMGPAEIVWRAKNVMVSVLEKYGVGLAMHPPMPNNQYGKPWVNQIASHFDREIYIKAADQIIAGRFNIFALKNVDLGFPPQWNRDPKTGIKVPLLFGKALDYRNKNVVGDIKYLWEPNRHYELVTMAQAFHISRDEKYAWACRQSLESWFKQSPYPQGAGWISALENAIRLVNWSVAWHLLGGETSFLFNSEEGLVFKKNWLASIYQHCHFINSHLSFYSSANNHLFGEYMGLWIGAITWPCWKESTQWGELARQGLEKEAIEQNASDGVNREQAIWYHHEVADMMLLCGLYGRANNKDFSEAYWKRLEAMLTFICALMNIEGHVPMIGDADGAVMVRLYPNEDFNVYQSLLSTGAVLFNRADFKVKGKHFDDKSRWLLGDSAEASLNHINKNFLKTDSFQVFPEGGYYVFGSGFDTPDEIKIIADAGALGYLSIAAHGHADALSLMLSVKGKEILIDPGTYSYHAEHPWRDYFRSTAAHNTVRVDGVDQSVMGGRFLWMHKAQAYCKQMQRDETTVTFIASHDGYQRLDDPVTHERTIKYDCEAQNLVITDKLICKSTHEVEIFWHFAETCLLEILDNQVKGKCEDVSFTVSMSEPAGLLPLLLKGSISPVAGWLSRNYDEKKEAFTLCWKGTIQGSTSLTTVFNIGKFTENND